jgi:hypothetical protein
MGFCAQGAALDGGKFKHGIFQTFFLNPIKAVFYANGKEKIKQELVA